MEFLKVGDVVKLKPRYHETGNYATIISIYKSESLAKDGWITFDYTVMTDTGNISHINYSCIEEKICVSETD
tara:strand:+ start:349 stop:564 length:216 start_codon:yes stop_codon:yes gene_type:complete